MQKGFIGIIISFIAAISMIFIYKDAQIMLEKTKNKSYVKQQNVQAKGFDDGQLVFKINIREIKQESYKHILFTKNITSGTVFNQNNSGIITNLKGDRGRINTNVKSVTITGNIKANIHPSTAKKVVRIESDDFFYNHKKEKAIFRSKNKLLVDNTELNAEKFTYNNKTETIHFNSETILKNKSSTTVFNSGEMDINNSSLYATDNVKTTYKNNETGTDYSDQIKELIKNSTTITAQALKLNFKNTDYSAVTYNQNVDVNQNDKSLKTDILSLNFMTEQYIASGDVTISLDNLKWLKKNDKKYKNSEIESMLNKSTKVMANQALFNAKNNTFTLKKDVIIKQINFKLTADQFDFDFSNDKMIAFGNVKVYKFGIEHLQTEQLIIDLKNETFKSSTPEELSEITLEL